MFPTNVLAFHFQGSSNVKEGGKNRNAFQFFSNERWSIYQLFLILIQLRTQQRLRALYRNKVLQYLQNFKCKGPLEGPTSDMENHYPKLAKLNYPKTWSKTNNSSQNYRPANLIFRFTDSYIFDPNWMQKKMAILLWVPISKTYSKANIYVKF